MSVGLSICLFVHLHVCLPICMSAYTPICLSTRPTLFLAVFQYVCLHPSVCPSICLYICMSNYQSACLPLHTFVCPLGQLFNSLFLSPTVYLSVRLSVIHTSFRVHGSLFEWTQRRGMVDYIFDNISSTVIVQSSVMFTYYSEHYF
jgi:hypothetical protein